jgi:hypothetical protein
MKEETIVVIILCLLLVGAVCAVFSIAYTSAVDAYNVPSETITVSQTYPRVDSYMYHVGPYVTTTDHKILYVKSDRDWVQLEIGGNYTVAILAKNACNGRVCDGEIVRVVGVS